MTADDSVPDNCSAAGRAIQNANKGISWLQSSSLYPSISQNVILHVRKKHFYIDYFL